MICFSPSGPFSLRHKPGMTLRPEPMNVPYRRAYRASLPDRPPGRLPAAWILCRTLSLCPFLPIWPKLGRLALRKNIFARQRPIPLPCRFTFCESARENFLNRFGMASGAIPPPVSATATSALLPDRVVETVTEPVRVYLIALFDEFRIASLTLVISARTSTCRPGCILIGSARPFCSACARIPSASSRVTCARSIRRYRARFAPVPPSTWSGTRI